jgi:hypothetical protein
MLLVGKRSYLKSALRYKLLIFYTHHPDALYLLQQGCGDPWLFFEDRSVLRKKKKGGKHCSSALKLTILPVNMIDLNFKFENWCQNILWLGAFFIQSIHHEGVQNVLMNQHTNQK